MRRLVLASGSPRRRELMSLVGLEYDVVVSDIDERIQESDPCEYVKKLSYAKAMSVLERLSSESGEEKGLAGNTTDGYIVVGADTIVHHNGSILTKPRDREDAYRIIKSLSGDVHQVYTGVSICTDERCVSFCEKTDVEVYDMTDEEIYMYIDTGEPMDKAGAYGIQGRFAAYVKGIRGDYNNVVGLPIARVVHELRNGGIYEQEY